MAYMSQEHKAKVNVALKSIIPNGYKWSLSVQNHSTLTLTVYKGPADLINIAKSNGYARGDGEYGRFIHSSFADAFKGHPDLIDLFTKVHAVMHEGNHNNSDPYTDYHDVGWYVSIDIGRYDKPYVNTAK